MTEFAVGDAVSVAPAFSLNDYGFYADTALAPVGAVIKHPATLSFEEAAAVWMAYLTAYDALLGTAQVAKGEFVVIPAASSSVGIAAIQVANMLGAVPIALTRTSAKREQIEAVRAAHVIATEEEDLVERLGVITSGKGVQVVFDPVGGPTFAKLLEAAAPRARINALRHHRRADRGPALPGLYQRPRYHRRPSLQHDLRRSQAEGGRGVDREGA